jgi:hypothetical protein
MWPNRPFKPSCIVIVAVNCYVQKDGKSCKVKKCYC